MNVIYLHFCSQDATEISSLSMMVIGSNKAFDSTQRFRLEVPTKQLNLENDRGTFSKIFVFCKITSCEDNRDFNEKT